MHSGFEIPTGIQHHHHQLQQQLQHNILSPENICSSSSLLLSPNPLEQIHTTSFIPQTQQPSIDQHHHFLPPQVRLPHHQYGGGGGVHPADFFPVNFKLGLNDICIGSNGNTSIVDKHNKEERTVVSGCINEGFRGSEQYAMPEVRHSSIGITHCWQNQQDSAIKQQPFWEPLPAEVSNENSEIVDRQENLEIRHRSESLTNSCLESKNRLLFGELEAIYKRLGTADSNQTGPSAGPPVNDPNPPVGLDHGSDANSMGEEASASASASQKNAGKKRKKKKKTKKEVRYEERLIKPMARFFEGLVKQVTDHQENLHNKFAEVIGRLDGERKEREEAWRNQELDHLKQEAMARAHEKALSESREATIVSYLEKITGQKINLDESRNGLKLNHPGS